MKGAEPATGEAAPAGRGSERSLKVNCAGGVAEIFRCFYWNRMDC